MKLYLAGPMRHRPLFNFPLFNSEAARLRSLGHEVHNPAEEDVKEGFDPATSTPLPLKHYMAKDLAVVCSSDAVAVLPNWTESEGAKLEVAVAKKLGIPILWASDLAPVKFLGGETKAATEEGEIRIKNPETGGEKGQKLQRFDLLPWPELTEVAELYGVGSKKYSPRNWEQGYKMSLSFGALMRHVTQFWNGEDHDSETKVSHLASVVFHALALMRFGKMDPALDDRPGKEAHDAKKHV